VYIVHCIYMIARVWTHARVWDFRVERRVRLFEVVPLGASVFNC
jgi:hypothetical protein